MSLGAITATVGTIAATVGTIAATVGAAAVVAMLVKPAVPISVNVCEVAGIQAPFGQRVRRGGCGGLCDWCSWHRLEEQPADDRVGAADYREGDHDVAGDRPRVVDATGECRWLLRVEHGAVGRTRELNLFDTAEIAPVEQVQRELVGVTVGDVDVDRERGIRVPDGSDPAGAGARSVLEHWGSVEVAARVTAVSLVAVTVA